MTAISHVYEVVHVNCSTLASHGLKQVFQFYSHLLLMCYIGILIVVYVMSILCYSSSKDSLIGLHPDEEAAINHALRQSLKATPNAPTQSEVMGSVSNTVMQMLAVSSSSCSEVRTCEHPTSKMLAIVV